MRYHLQKQHSAFQHSDTCQSTLVGRAVSLRWVGGGADRLIAGCGFATSTIGIQKSGDTASIRIIAQRPAGAIPP